MINVCGGGFSTGVSFGKDGVMPMTNGLSGEDSRSSSYSRRIFWMTPKKLSSMSFSSFSDDLSDSTSAFSCASTRFLTSTDLRPKFLGKAIPNFLPKRLFLLPSLSSVGEVGDVTALGGSLGVAGIAIFVLSDEVSERLLALLLKEEVDEK